jgi:hypothetical protein
MRTAVVATGLEGDIRTGQLVALIHRERNLARRPASSSSTEQRVSQANVKMWEV